MTKQMLIDASHPEETRVVVLTDNRLDEFDYETAAKSQLKGNIYLAKVTRVEPSLQAAFVDYGGNRHGFLPFSEIHPDYYRIPIDDRDALIAEEAALRNGAGEDEDGHDENGAAEETAAASAENGGRRTRRSRAKKAEKPDSENAENGEGAIEEIEVETKVDTLDGDDSDDDARKRAKFLRRYKIQEVIKRRQVLLVQVVKEERGNKGAALTSYLSLPGRYCVLMPNTNKGGGISRKIANPADRRRLKKVIAELEIPEGMAVIVRTAGSQRSKAEIRRDYDYLLRLWSEIRETTLQSTAPALIYEEANLIKRAIRDLYSREMDEIQIAGEDGYRTAKTFMKNLVPSHARKIHLYKDEGPPIFQRYQVERQLDAMHNSVVQLASGGYVVLNPTEALVAIDVNSGKSTRERHIEGTALRTNLEAANEIARQLRLRDLAGLIVIDFIDMEESRNNREVERRLKEAMRHDRARIQLGRISPFGLLELSRQRLRPSLLESSTVVCASCGGSGRTRSIDSSALHVLRTLEEEGLRRGGDHLNLSVPTDIAFYLLNQMRDRLMDIERRYDFKIEVERSDGLIPPNFELRRLGLPIAPETAPSEPARDAAEAETVASEDEGRKRRRRRRSRKRDEVAAASGAEDTPPSDQQDAERGLEDDDEVAVTTPPETDEDDEKGRKPRRRRGKRGGRRRARRGREDSGPETGEDALAETEASAPTEDGDVAASAEAESDGDAADPSRETAKSGRRRRGRKVAARKDESDAANEAELVDTPADDAGADATKTEESTDASPRPARPRRSRREPGRTRKPADIAPEAIESAEPEAPTARNDNESAARPEEIDKPAEPPLAAGPSRPEETAEPVTAPPNEGSRSAQEDEDDSAPKRRGWWNRFI